jgi:hypothetical protein
MIFQMMDESATNEPKEPFTATPSHPNLCICDELVVVMAAVGGLWIVFAVINCTDQKLDSRFISL